MDKAKLYKALFACCDKKNRSIRPILKGVNHQLVGNQWVLGASDGYVAVQAYLPATELPEDLNGYVKALDGKTLTDGMFPFIPGITPNGEPKYKSKFDIKALKELAKVVDKEANGLPVKWKIVNRLILNGVCLNGVCLNVRFLQKALSVMELYGDTVTIEAHVKRQSTEEHLAISKLKVLGTESYCLICPAKPWGGKDAKLAGIEGEKVDYTIDEARELLAKQKVKKTEKPKSWYE